MRQYTQKQGKKRLYLVEMYQNVNDGFIYRGYYASSPTQAVQELKAEFSDGTWKFAVMRFRILTK